ncbi:MAG: XdhC family protein [Pseudomonadota bacterium]
MKDGDIENILPTLVEWAGKGERCVVATLVWAEGTSPRPPGSQMLISENGQSLGYLTGGCAEHAIVAEALAAMRENAPRAVRFGVGSPYLDIQLPCGSGIDVFFDTHPSLQLAHEILATLDSRVPAALRTSIGAGSQTLIAQSADSPPEVSEFDRWYYPRRRFLIAGAGPIVDELAVQAMAQGYRIDVLSPDEPTLQRLGARDIDATLLSDAGQMAALQPDAYTAAALVFHEHEREPDLLLNLLDSPAFYIAALGSRGTHQARLERLRRIAPAVEGLDRIHGPAGLNIGAANPSEIAVSILAQCVSVYRAQSIVPLHYRGPALTHV